MHLTRYVARREITKRLWLGSGSVFFLSFAPVLLLSRREQPSGFASIGTLLITGLFLAIGIFLGGWQVGHYRHLLTVVFGDTPFPEAKKQMERHFWLVTIGDIMGIAVASVLISVFVWEANLGNNRWFVLGGGIGGFLATLLTLVAHPPLARALELHRQAAESN